MDLHNSTLALHEWEALIHQAELGEVDEPLVNLNPDDDREYDAIFVGGGAGGRFGSAYLHTTA